MNPLCGLLIATLLALGALACGGSTSAPRSASRPSRSLAGGSAAARVPFGQRPRIGDYDADERQSRSDSDDDDSIGPQDRDGDTDSRAGGLLDGDDGNLLAHTHPAGRSDRLAIESLVRGYFAAATKGDGARVCSMISPAMASAVRQNDGPPGSARAVSCAAILAGVYRFNHAQLTAEAQALGSIHVRLRANQAVAVVDFHASFIPIRTLEASRAAGAWELADVLDREMP